MTFHIYWEFHVVKCNNFFINYIAQITYINTLTGGTQNVSVNNFFSEFWQKAGKYYLKLSEITQIEIGVVAFCYEIAVYISPRCIDIFYPQIKLTK